MKRFRMRAFVSFSLFGAFIVSAVSGIILYFRPEGTLASWTGWAVLGMDKKAWEGVHTVTIFALIVFTVLHIILNWKALWGYLRRPASRASGAKVEFIAALVLIALITAAAIGNWEPFERLIAARSAIKQGSLAVDVPPPFADAVDRSLADICAAVSVSLEEGLARLAQAGLKVQNPARTLAEISEELGVSPEQIYRLVSRK